MTPRWRRLYELALTLSPDELAMYDIASVVFLRGGIGFRCLRCGLRVRCVPTDPEVAIRDLMVVHRRSCLAAADHT